MASWSWAGGRFYDKRLCTKCNRWYIYDPPSGKNSCPDPICKSGPSKSAVQITPAPLRGEFKIDKSSTELVNHDPQIRAVISNRFDMLLVRGEDPTRNHTPPDDRFQGGLMVIKDCWGTDVPQVFEKLREEIRIHGGTTNDFAQWLRKESRPGALAFARSEVGAFDNRDWVYKLNIANARTFYWGADFTLGPPAPYSSIKNEFREWRDATGKTHIDRTKAITTDYIVLNADTLKESTILGFGHVTDTFEVTLFTPPRIDWVTSCTARGRGELISQLKAKSKGNT